MGELVVDLFTEACPLATRNFLKLCKTKYYNNVLFFNVQENFMVQAGDPTGTGRGGQSIFGQLYGAQADAFEDEIRPQYTHNKKGMVGMANTGPNTNRSQFYITTRGEDMDYLDGKHTLFGEVVEGLDVLDKINEAFVDDDCRPYQDIRIRHTYVLDDPFPDPELLPAPPSPDRLRPEQETVDERLAAEDLVDEHEGRTEQEIEQSVREKEAKSRAVVLEMIGDLPDADVKPPEEVLFVCKLNPVTESDDLDIAFSRFGPCKSEVIRDFKTGDSLCFAFVEFKEKKHCEEAYFKMNNVLLDDRRIKVDFSQSVSKLWNKVTRRPWEKHSKSDGDPYANEKRDAGKKRELMGGGGGGARLQLKAKHQQGKEFDLVDEHEGKAKAVSSSSRRRPREDHERREDASSRRHRDDGDNRKKRSYDRRDNESRDRAKRARSRSRERTRRSLDREDRRDRDDRRHSDRRRGDDRHESRRSHRSRSRSQHRDESRSRRR